MNIKPNPLVDYNWSLNPKITPPRKTSIKFKAPNFTSIQPPPPLRTSIHEATHVYYIGQEEPHTNQPYDPLEPVINSIECLYGFYNI